MMEKGRRYKLWWYGEGLGGVRVMMKELCEVLKVRKVSDGVPDDVGF